MEALPGSPQAVLAAMKAPPHLKPEDVDEFERHIGAGRRLESYEDPFSKKRPGAGSSDVLCDPCRLVRQVKQVDG
jgi:hypothetical protein